jgi:two-component system response regulator AgrA
MMRIIVCDDDLIFKEKIHTTIQNYLIIQEYDAKLVSNLNIPSSILEYIEKNKVQGGLYFLDIELNMDVNGLGLGAKIREIDQLAKIVFITTHAELSYLSFTYKIEALDFIPKDIGNMLSAKINECVEIAYERYLSTSLPDQQNILIKIGSQDIKLKLSEILYIESSTIPHKLIAHLESRKLEFYGKIKDFEDISEKLVRCHQSYIVNIDNINFIDKKRKFILLHGGEQCLISNRFYKRLKDTVEKIGRT